MRDLIRIFALGIILIFASCSYAADEVYRVLILPDNIVTDSDSVDAYIYNQPSEFFADGIINLLNQTDYIKSPTVSEERTLLKSNPSNVIAARNLTNKFKTSYNIDFVTLKKVASKSNARHVLLLTTAVDAENYILRRTLWDFLNIPGATVVDPAYKLNTYAVLVDTKNNTILWSNTFYKTISACENRIITRGPSPQTQQLEKIKDYSRMLCPEIAQNVQVNVLPANVYSRESNQIYYDMGNFDNVFTKKYRRWRKEGGKDLRASGSNIKNKVNSTKKNRNKKRLEAAQRKAVKAEQARQVEQVKKEVKAEPVKESQKTVETGVQNINYKTQAKPVAKSNNQSLYDPIDIKKTKKNTLYGEYDNTRPKLRDYTK